MRRGTNHLIRIILGVRSEQPRTQHDCSHQYTPGANHPIPASDLLAPCEEIQNDRNRTQFHHNYLVDARNSAWTALAKVVSVQ